MNDIENHVFTYVSNAIKAQFPEAYVTGEYVRAPETFPCVNIVEQDNYIATDHYSNSGREDFSVVMFEITVYSNKTFGKKSEAREIFKIADMAMFELNFTRLSLSPIPNMEDASIYRLVGRYRAETNGQTIYRR